MLLWVLKNKPAVMGIWLAVDRWMKPSCASKSVEGKILGSGEGGGWSRILYQKVGAEAEAIVCDSVPWICDLFLMLMVFHQMTRSGNNFLIDELGPSSATNVDFDTATALLVLLALQEHHQSSF